MTPEQPKRFRTSPDGYGHCWPSCAPRLLGHAALGEPQAQVASGRRRRPLGSRVTGGAVPAATIRSMVRRDTPSSSASCGHSQATDGRRTSNPGRRGPVSDQPGGLGPAARPAASTRLSGPSASGVDPSGRSSVRRYRLPGPPPRPGRAQGRPRHLPHLPRGCLVSAWLLTVAMVWLVCLKLSAQGIPTGQPVEWPA